MRTGRGALKGEEDNVAAAAVAVAEPASGRNTRMGMLRADCVCTKVGTMEVPVPAATCAASRGWEIVEGNIVLRERDEEKEEAAEEERPV
jgi:hypothetical protein